MGFNVFAAFLAPWLVFKCASCLLLACFLLLYNVFLLLTSVLLSFYSYVLIDELSNSPSSLCFALLYSLSPGWALDWLRRDCGFCSGFWNLSLDLESMA